MERLAAAFEALLEDALADPSRRLLGFELPAEPVARAERTADPRLPANGSRARSTDGYRIEKPASTGMTAPVMRAAASEASQVIVPATSAAEASEPSG